MPSPELRVEAIVPFMRCPDRRCQRTFVHAETAAPFRGIAKCTRRTCSQRWMAEPLAPGNVRAQLRSSLEDAEYADDLMRRLHLQEWIFEPSWLQIPLNAELWNDYVSTRGQSAHDRQKRLILRVIQVLRVKSA